MEHIGHYTRETFPKSRLATMDIGAIGKKKHHIIALIELDVTDARRMIREKKQTDGDISFNSWLLKCISLAVETYKPVHGVRQGKRNIILFDDIDISIVVEREINGKKVPLPYVVRQTNLKSIQDICREIRGGQSQDIRDEADYVLGERKSRFRAKVYYLFPGSIRRLVWRVITASPFLTKQNMGTIIVSSVGMMGRLNGWVIPVSVHPLCFAVGSVVKKPGVVQDRIEIREILHITALVDHDVVDGAPAVRVLNKLTHFVENGYGLD